MIRARATVPRTALERLEASGLTGEQKADVEAAIDAIDQIQALAAR